jgi:beta-lactamase regulating signal transducer with metallopeptidase domain
MNSEIVWECLWKTSVVTLAIWLVTLLMRRRSAALRHALWLGSVTAFLVVPALVLLARRTPPIQVAVHVPAVLETLPVAAIETAPPTPTVKGKTSWAGPLLRWTWWIGVLILVGRRGRAVVRMRGITKRSQPASLGALFPVRISAEVRTPLTFGLVRPVILLPPCALEWSQELLESVLEHEQEHIRRYDPLSHWIAELVCVTWWFHPLAWLARSRAAHERECACDDAVLRSGVRPGDYASELLNLAAALPKKGEPVMALSAYLILNDASATYCFTIPIAAPPQLVPVWAPRWRPAL